MLSHWKEQVLVLCALLADEIWHALLQTINFYLTTHIWREILPLNVPVLGGAPPVVLQVVFMLSLHQAFPAHLLPTSPLLLLQLLTSNGVFVDFAHRAA